jgi:hypothetical protein
MRREVGWLGRKGQGFWRHVWERDDDDDDVFVLKTKSPRLSKTSSVPTEGYKYTTKTCTESPRNTSRWVEKSIIIATVEPQAHLYTQMVVSHRLLLG